MKFDQLQKARRVLIYGYGEEGKAAHRFISKKFPTLRINLHDDKKQKLDRKINFSSFDVIVLSPGISINKLKGVNKKNITSVTDLFFDNISDAMRRKVIGITGTKGKSTTVKFTTEMLTQAGYKATAGGNFGVPLLKLFEDFVKEKYDYIVAELSSYQLENMQTSPGIALFVNLYRDHLDRHGTMGKYREAKKNIYRYQKSGDTLILPKRWKTFAGKRKAILSSPAPKTLFPEGSVFRESHHSHFLENFGIVVALASHLDIPKKIISKTAKHFKGLPHRLEFITRKCGIEFYDDSISTNPDSTLAGVVSFDKKLGSIILGGQDRKQNFKDLIKKLKKLRVWIIILESETSTRILKTATTMGYKRINLVKNMKEAVAMTLQLTPIGKVCLLSTAAPSYDNFKNYQEKGKVFKKSVLNPPIVYF